MSSPKPAILCITAQLRQRRVIQGVVCENWKAIVKPNDHVAEGKHVLIESMHMWGEEPIAQEAIIGEIRRWERRWVEYEVKMVNNPEDMNVTLLVPVKWARVGFARWCQYASTYFSLPDNTPGPY